MFLKWVIQKNYQDKPETSDIKLSCYDVRQKVFCLMIPTNRFALSAPVVPKNIGNPSYLDYLLMFCEFQNHTFSRKYDLLTLVSYYISTNPFLRGTIS